MRKNLIIAGHLLFNDNHTVKLIYIKENPDIFVTILSMKSLLAIILLISALVQAAECPLPKDFIPVEPPQPIHLSDIVLAQSGWSLVNIWALWCAPCRQELPLLDAYNATHPPLAITTINLDDGQTAVIQLFKTLNITHLLPQSTNDNSTLQQFKVVGLPFTGILHNGKLIAAKNGILRPDDPENINHYIYCQQLGETK